jgi:uncharacterized DUF497 family protein
MAVQGAPSSEWPHMAAAMDRFILIRYSRQQRLLYVVYAEVQVDAIRIISARKATRHDKTRYEND